MLLEIKKTKRAEEILIALNNHILLHRKSMRKSLNQIGRDVIREDVRLIKSPPKTGRIYRFRGGLHQASAPGEAPANRTGRLARSARFATRNYQEMRVGETAYYAKFLEEGTRKMAPRPHLVKAISANYRNAVRILEENGRKEITK